MHNAFTETKGTFRGTRREGCALLHAYRDGRGVLYQHAVAVAAVALQVATNAYGRITSNRAARPTPAHALSAVST